MTLFSIDEFCSMLSLAIENRPTSSLDEASQDFLRRLDLPRAHPFCGDGFEFTQPDIPPMGSLLQDIHESRLEVFVSFICMHLPALMAIGDLWMRLFAGFLAPIGCLVLVKCNLQSRGKVKRDATNVPLLSSFMLSTVAFSLVWMTDSMYVIEFGPFWGVLLFVTSSALALRLCMRHNLYRTKLFLAVLIWLAIYLCFENGELHFGNPDDTDIRVSPGLYYDHNNSIVRDMVQVWPEEKYTYSDWTPWMLTGDARTGLPFYLYSQTIDQQPSTRVFLNASDGECLALDIYFPVERASNSMTTAKPPLYLILHGVNGGSNEEYVKDLVYRATRKGSTVVVMVSRGLMDLPIRGWNIFHAARLTDVHETAVYLKSHVVQEGQVLSGVGYSMGAIVLNNYASTYGSECALDIGFSISGAMECRHEAYNERAKRLWLPLVAELTRFSQLTAKWANRLAYRLPREDMLALLRSRNVVEADQYAAASYNGYRDLMHYYSESGALGDVPWEHLKRSPDMLESEPKISKLAIPLCVLQSFDDPISTIRTIVGNEGLMRPDSLVQLGQGHLILLLTRRGGHVGWPKGWRPWKRKWEFMSEAAISFTEALAEVKQHW
jgi:predicted alpha/beta-fold hydrolase